jgi:hypothetical protein
MRGGQTTRRPARARRSRRYDKYQRNARRLIYAGRALCTTPRPDPESHGSSHTEGTNLAGRLVHRRRIDRLGRSTHRSRLAADGGLHVPPNPASGICVTRLERPGSSFRGQPDRRSLCGRVIVQRAARWS